MKDVEKIKLAEQEKAMKMFLAIKKITDSGYNAEIKCVKGTYKIMKVTKNIQTEFAVTI